MFVCYLYSLFKIYSPTLIILLTKPEKNIWEGPTSFPFKLWRKLFDLLDKLKIIKVHVILKTIKFKIF